MAENVCGRGHVDVNVYVTDQRSTKNSTSILKTFTLQRQMSCSHHFEMAFLTCKDSICNHESFMLVTHHAPAYDVLQNTLEIGRQASLKPAI